MPFRTLREEDFIGRQDELRTLYHRSLQAHKGVAQSAILSGRRGIGKTELLKQLFNHLFWKQAAVVPFYYAVNNAILSVSEFAKDFLTQYIRQRLAFERKEASLIRLDMPVLDDLDALAEAEDAAWVRELLHRYRAGSKEPVDALRISLDVPHQSSLATGKPAVIMIDDFHRLKFLQRDGSADARLIFLFEGLFSSKRTPCLIAGNDPEIQEMPIAGMLSRLPARPLSPEAASFLFSSLLGVYGVERTAVPPVLLSRFGGNPFYLRCVASAAGLQKSANEKDFWNAYVNELTDGAIYLYWSSVLKGFFRDADVRRHAIEICNKLYHSEEPLTVSRIAKVLSLDERYADTLTASLHLSGLVHGEFGMVRAPDDAVLKDFMTTLHQKEILGKSVPDIAGEMQEQPSAEQGKPSAIELVVPMVKDAELIAAQCLDQLGKNLQASQEAIGQLQIAVIEACINAIEHGGGTEKKMFLTFDASEDQIEVSIESPGREFVSPETGEPFFHARLQDDAWRGWGMKLMEKFTDGVRFEKSSRGTKVILTKKISKAGDLSREGVVNDG